MQFFKRVRDIVSSNVNSALDKFEDPQKMIALMVTNLEELQTKTRSSIAGKKAELISLKHRAKEAEETVGRWAERAKLAVTNGKEDLAREAGCSRTVLASAKGSTCWLSMPPPQNTTRSPNLAFSSAGSMPPALICTGFRMSTPLSRRSGMYSMQSPHVWYQTFASVSPLMRRTRLRWRGRTISR